MDIYQQELERYQVLFQKEWKLHNIISLSRIGLVALAGLSGFLYFKYDSAPAGIMALICTVAFILLVRSHIRVRQRKLFYEQLVRLNEHELAALRGDFSNFKSGEQYTDPHHDYAFDLDIFGENSIYQYLNRTANTIGEDALARYFLRHQSRAEILETQAAVRDLAAQLNLRQEFLATGRLHPDEKSGYRMLLKWSEIPVEPTNGLWRVLWYVLPVATIATGTAYWFLETTGLWNALLGLTTLNLVLVAAHSRKIRSELEYLNAIFKVVEQYGYLVRHIENGQFSAPKLVRIQQGLQTDGTPASRAIIELSSLLHQLESVQNLFGALIFNSLFLYHIHILLALERWKLRHAPQLKAWIDSIGEMEALCSLAHFSFNNPDFVFPDISDTPGLKFTRLGHPLIPEEKRVCNDIRFAENGFVILTGSNMSGKSTFLRTIGINLLLAGIGAPVCAAECRTFNFNIFVCMKLSDSLHHNESYFYAELKRLKHIIDQLEAGVPGFVLLDEVLRGTNSNDKLTGTLGLIETMVRLQSTGLLATHDLNVCDLRSKYPDALRNMCFEVEMTAGDLHFDYRLRDGVCVNKSASFLMKKMGVIE